MPCHAVTFTLSPLTLDVCHLSAVTWSNCVPNFSEIEQSAATLLRFILNMSNCGAVSRDPRFNGNWVGTPPLDFYNYSRDLHPRTKFTEIWQFAAELFQRPNELFSFSAELAELQHFREVKWVHAGGRLRVACGISVSGILLHFESSEPKAKWCTFWSL